MTPPPAADIDSSSIDQDELDEIIYEAEGKEPIESVDMLTSYPNFAKFTSESPGVPPEDVNVNTYKVDHEGQEVYLVMMEEDGAVYEDNVSNDDLIRLANSPEEAQEKRAEIIGAWENGWKDVI